MKEKWHDLGKVSDLKKPALRQIKIGDLTLALSFQNGEFGVISNFCNHVGGPLGQGHLEGDYVVCPWHQYRFHCRSGQGEKGYEEDRVPSYAVRVEKNHLWVNLEPLTKRNHLPHTPHPLTRALKRQKGRVRVLGISTTVMNKKYPRFSTSEVLLESALAQAERDLKVETKLLRLNDLSFRECEGYYSKAARACTWPCTITLQDATDEMEQVYEGLVHWADVVVVATPIRWGQASTLYYKMAERMNCIQNQITTHNRELIKNKVAGFIITGGQDNIQAVAGNMLGFFAELGFSFPPYPYIAHSRGWSAEDMEKNIAYVADSQDLRQGAFELIARAKETVESLMAAQKKPALNARGGRKAQTIKLQEIKK